MKVLILTAGFGDGHNAAARNIRDALERLDPENAQVEVLDLLEAVYGRFNQLAKSAYLGLIRHAPGLWNSLYHLLDQSPSLSSAGSWGRLRTALGDLLNEAQPDVVVSTYPVYADVIAELFRDHAERPFRFYTVVTDSVSVNSAWFRSPSDRFCVANEGTAAVLREGGVDREKVVVTGFPVSPWFVDEGPAPIEVLPPGNRRKILYVVNHGMLKNGRVLEDLLAIPGAELTVAAGRDQRMKSKLQERFRDQADRVQVYGWTNLMPRLLSRHHLVIGKAGGASVQEAIAARCPMIINQIIPGHEEGNAQLIVENDCGTVAPTRRELVGAVLEAFKGEAAVWRRWRANLQRHARADGAYRIAHLVLNEEILEDRPILRRITQTNETTPARRSGPSPSEGEGPLLCDFHIHTNYSDGKLTVAEVVDFYGAHGFDCICITDHLADTRGLMGKLSRLSRLTLPPSQLSEYFEVIRREADRAWRRYRMIVMTGIEFNKDGCRPKTSAHLLGIDLTEPIPPNLDLPETIARIHDQAGLAVASHPHLMKSEWGKNTLYLWENQEVFAPLIDAWEVANRDNLFTPVALKRLPYLANSDFHKPRHIYSWKTVLDCPKDPVAIKHCIRRNERVSIRLYREQERFVQGASVVPLPTPLPVAAEAARAVACLQ